MRSGIGIVRLLLVAALVIFPLRASPSAAPRLFNQGGPDTYGYRYIDNINESLGPIHAAVWQDISSTGTPLAITGAASAVATFTVPIMVRYYGQNWGAAPSGSGLSVVSPTFSVSANGWVALMGATQAALSALFANQNFPSTDTRITPGGWIAVLWDNWGAGSGRSAHWEVIGSAPNRRLVIQWTNWGTTGSPLTFQLQMTESFGQADSDIYMTYTNVDTNTATETGSSATIGMQAQNGTSSIVYSFNVANSTTPYTGTTPPTPRTIAYYTGANPPRIGAGEPPDPPTNVQQTGSFGSMAQGDWTATSVAFQATVTDPDLVDGAPQGVVLEARYRKVGNGNWTTVRTDAAGSPQGPLSISVNLAASNPEGNFGDGFYDWEYRARDVNFSYWPPDANGLPLWQPFQGNGGSPDFRSDQVPADPPVAVSPASGDVESPHEFAHLVNFRWGASTDNGPASALRYEIQVSRNEVFTDLETAASNIVSTDTTLSVTVSRFTKYWRVRTTDIGGNVSPWSNIRQFRLVWDDGENHSAGDAQKACGFSAPRGGASGVGVLILVLAGLAVLYRRHRP